MWVLEEEAFVQKRIRYVGGLYKIFDEILVNAADNYQRDKKMTKIEVKISKGEISVLNDGKGIPVQLHKVHKVYVPELIFGHLLTSSNYEDKVKKVVGGRNGYGAKLANIFSSYFEVEAADSLNKKIYKQIWRNNMKDKEEPQIERYGGTDFTKVTFRPDFGRF
jgi:DNA topoisomerase II